jgi:hypothetical protein
MDVQLHGDSSGAPDLYAFKSSVFATLGTFDRDGGDRPFFSFTLENARDNWAPYADFWVPNHGDPPPPVSGRHIVSPVVKWQFTVFKHVCNLHSTILRTVSTYIRYGRLRGGATGICPDTLREIASACKSLQPGVVELLDMLTKRYFIGEGLYKMAGRFLPDEDRILEKAFVGTLKIEGIKDALLLCKEKPLTDSISLFASSCTIEVCARHTHIFFRARC